jgi:hypothetical protein
MPQISKEDTGHILVTLGELDKLITTRHHGLENAVFVLKSLLDQPEGEPVATLHDDGYYTFKTGKQPYKASFAGWKMDVFTHPPAPQPLQPITADDVTDEMIDELARQCPTYNTVEVDR